MAFFITISVLNAKNDSATYDEVAHISAGYSYLTQHDNRLNPEHPPLIKDLAALPLLFLHLNFNVNGQDFWTGNLPNLWDDGQWAAGRYFLYQAENNPDEITFWARLPIILLSVILGLFLFKWGKEIAGISAGIFVLALYAFDPNILGHNHFVTTDLGVAAFLTFSFYYFLKFVKNPSWKNVLLGGFFMGLLLVSKFSSIVVLPIYALVLVSYPLIKNNYYRNDWKTRLSDLAEYFSKGIIALLVAVAVIWVVYEANTFTMPKETFAKTIDFFFSSGDSNVKASFTNNVLHLLNSNSLTRPLGAYFFGPAWTFKRVSGGNGSYFLGQVGNGFTWYFPVVFLIKETLPFLMLSFFALFYTAFEMIRSAVTIKNMGSKITSFLRKSVVEYSIFAFILLYAAISIKGGLNIGFRHLFPILPFAFLLIAKKVFDFLRDRHPMTHQAFRFMSLFLLLWIIAIPVVNYPSYTSYFNESIGGSQNGYKYVTDSNTDWGQDLKRLKTYLDQHPEIDKIRVDYFGGGDIRYYIGDKYVMWYDSMRPVQLGWYAISTNFLQGSIYDIVNKNPSNNYAWTQQYKPVTMIGKSMLIYHITKLPILQ
jgi:hypothetical protein